MAKKLDEYGQSCHCFILPQDMKVSAKCKQPTTDELYGDVIQVDTDTEDKNLNFSISVSKGGCDDNSLDSDNNDIKNGNEEI